MELDGFDRRILRQLQIDADRSHAAIGDEVGLSGSAVRRRVEAMRKAGVIAGYVALVRDVAANAGILVIVTVTFERETPLAYQAFRAAMQADEHVMQCYATSGQFDFVLVVAAPDPQAYEAWGERTLMANPSLRRYDSFVVWSTVKFSLLRPRFERP